MTSAVADLWRRANEALCVARHDLSVDSETFGPLQSL